MSALLRPAAGEIGRTSTNLEALLHDTIEAWTAGIAAIREVDLDAPSRRRGRTIRDVLLPVGGWPGSRTLADMRAAALTADHRIPPRQLIEAELRHRFGDISNSQLVDSWSQTRDDIAEWADSKDSVHEAHLLVGGPIGVIPLGTLVGATAFQICVALRDTGVDETELDDRLLRWGLHALVDTAGAISANYLADRPTQAQQSALPTPALTLRVLTSHIRVGMGADSNSWRTALLPDPAPGNGPTISGSAETIIDIAAARRSPITASVRREVTVQDLGGLLEVATALASSPDLPGGDSLRAAVSAARGAGTLGRLLKSRFNQES
jgi:hypothetical protein